MTRWRISIAALATKTLFVYDENGERVTDAIPKVLRRFRKEHRDIAGQMGYDHWVADYKPVGEAKT